MKKFLLSLIFGIGVMCSMSSCVTPAYSQDVVITESDGNVDISYVIRYGTPYYFEGSLLYYLYNGWYYYPYYMNNRWYYYRYERPFDVYRGYRFHPQPNHRPYFDSRRPPRHNGRVMPPRDNRGGRGFGSERVAPDRPRSSTHVTAPPTRQTPNSPRVTVPNRTQSTPQATPRTTPNRSFGTMGGGRSAAPSRPQGGAAPSRPQGGHSGGGGRSFGGRR